jgi:hypothetical protein
MSRPRKPGQPIAPKPRPALRLVPSPGERPATKPDPKLKEILDGLRRQDARRVGVSPGPEDKDAA